jgi:adenylyltransferase
MRTEREIIDNIIGVAVKDESVRAVIRTDLLPVREYLYTYNFYFIVNNVEKYNDDKVFEKCFGERVLLYRGDKNYPDMFPNTKAHLMVFCDGVTIVINTIDKDTFLHKYNGEIEYENVWIGDTFQKILDKDNALPKIERLEERKTLFAQKPTEIEFVGTCNEFLWVLKTFVEYTLREELPSAMFYLNVAVRDLINKMLRWHIYLKADQPVDMGILDSNLEKMLEQELFLMYKKTYAEANYVSIWKAYDAVVELWRKVGRVVAEQCGYYYPNKTEKDMLKFIRRLREHKFVN